MDPYCKGCVYYAGCNGWEHCTYIFDKGHRRPCPPGRYCTEKKLGQKHLQSIKLRVSYEQNQK